LITEPEIRYLKTSDGVSIAYWTMGQGGTPLVLSSPLLFTHASFELRHPVLRPWYERLASKRMIVRYDHRGEGLSQRNVGPVSRSILVDDFAQLVDALRLDRFDMAGFNGPAMTHIAYAAAHPARIRRLVLWSAGEDNRGFWADQLRAVLSLIETDWELFTETFTHVWLGWTGDLAHEWAAFMRLAINQEDAAHLFSAIAQDDVRADLPLVKAPTLVMYEAEGRREFAESAAFIASTIPDARLLPLPHKLIPAYESEPGTRAIENFLADGTSPMEPDISWRAAPRATPPHTRLSVIHKAHNADSTGLTQRKGDAAFRAKARELDVVLRERVRENGGSVIDAKTLGDGILATFAAASQAIAAALSFENEARTIGLSLHVGVHAGDVMREQDNIFGGAVNIVARISALSAPGEVLVSDVVRALARTSAGVAFEDRGEHELKGVSEPQRVYAVAQLGA
jgi:class 3 adenylate cyclase/pimeloyl-ACP methyl ester carboxylesterase